MNKTRRKEINELYKRVELLKAAVENLPDAEELKGIADDLKTEEEDYRDNMPESMQNGDKGSAASEAVDYLTTATDKLDEIDTAITTLVDDLTEVMEALDNAGAGTI